MGRMGGTGRMGGMGRMDGMGETSVLPIQPIQPIPAIPPIPPIQPLLPVPASAVRVRLAQATAWWKRDARVPFALLLTMYAAAGSSWLGFNRSPAQLALTVLVGCALD